MERANNELRMTRIERAFAEISKRAETDLEKFGTDLEKKSKQTMSGWFPVWFTVIGAGAVALGLLGGRFLVEGHGISNARAKRACVVVVQRLMSTNDPVEVRRDGILIDHLHCDVVRRAVPVLVPKDAP